MSRSRLSINKLKKLNYNGLIFKNVKMSEYCTLKCGGEVKILLVINTLENFLHVMKYLKKINVKFFILGAGSNLLVSDNGFDGVVIKLGGDFARIEYCENCVVECGAGVTLAKLISYAKDLGLSGVEDGIGIPATIGGAVFMNASAYNFEMSKIVKYVVAYKDEKITYFDNFVLTFQTLLFKQQ